MRSQSNDRNSFLKNHELAQTFEPILESTFQEGRQQQDRTPRFVLLNNEGLTCFETPQNRGTIRFTFEAIADNLFEIIYDKSNEKVGSNIVGSKPIGFRLISKDKIISQLRHKSTQVVIQFRQNLRKKFNQRGFSTQFRPIKKIGKGSFGSVYLAQRIEDNLKVAVKAFSKCAISSQERGKDAVINEIKMLRKFNHKNIVQLFDVYQSQNSIYMVMQNLAGGNLMQKIDSDLNFTLSQVKKIMHGLLKGLAHMHSLKIMHRDIKPQNLIFRKKQSLELVIADFGLATDSDAEQYLFIRCGTPGYVAPEVINITDFTQKSNPICDVFSVGIIFHMLLLGRSIFEGETYKEVLAQNRACNINLEGPQYDDLQITTRSLLTQMLDVAPQHRLTASGALNHQYFRKSICRCISCRSKVPRTPIYLIETAQSPVKLEPIRLTVANTSNIHSQQRQMIRQIGILENISAVTLSSSSSNQKLKKKGLRS